MKRQRVVKTESCEKREIRGRYEKKKKGKKKGVQKSKEKEKES